MTRRGRSWRGLPMRLLIHDREIAAAAGRLGGAGRAAGPMVLRRARGRVPGTLPLPPGFGGGAGAGLRRADEGGDLSGEGRAGAAVPSSGRPRRSADARRVRSGADRLCRRCSTIARAGGLRPAPRVFRASRRPRRGGCRWCGCSIIMPIWRPVWGTTAGRWTGGRWRGSCSTGWGWARTARSGAARCCWATIAGSSGSGHLKPAPLAGGDGPARSRGATRMVRLDQAGMAADGGPDLRGAAASTCSRQAVRRGINAPLSSSAGRLFDAVAAVLGVCAGAAEL